MQGDRERQGGRGGGGGEQGPAVEEKNLRLQEKKRNQPKKREFDFCDLLGFIFFLASVVRFNIKVFH